MATKLEWCTCYSQRTDYYSFQCLTVVGSRVPNPNEMSLKRNTGMFQQCVYVKVHVICNSCEGIQNGLGGVGYDKSARNVQAW